MHQSLAAQVWREPSTVRTTGRALEKAQLGGRGFPLNQETQSLSSWRVKSSRTNKHVWALMIAHAVLDGYRGRHSGRKEQNMQRLGTAWWFGGTRKGFVRAGPQGQGGEGGWWWEFPARWARTSSSFLEGASHSEPRAYNLI